MSCRRRTTVLRIPASALGFRYRREWDEFLNKHDSDFAWEPGHFADALCDNYPDMMKWKNADFHSPDWLLDQRCPAEPEIIPGPFLDYFLEDEELLDPEDYVYGMNDTVRPLEEREKKKYLPKYKRLFPDFTIKDMDAVRWCSYEWYDGTEARYMYSDEE